MNILISSRFQRQRFPKDIDFLPLRIRAARKKRRNRILFSLIGVLLAVGLYFLYTYPQHLIRKYEHELTVENALVQDLEKGKEVYDRLQAKKARHDAMLATLDEIEKQRFEPLELLDKIGNVLPGGVSISKLSVLPNKVSITVVSASPIDTARVLVALRKTDLFKEVELPSAPMLQEPKEITFDLALKDKPAETKSVVNSLLDKLKEFANIFTSGEGGVSGRLTGESNSNKTQKSGY